MKKLILSLIFIAIISILHAKEGYEVTFNKLSATTSEVRFTLDDFDLRTVTLGGNEFTKILFDGRVVTKDKGFAELPFINVNVQLGADNNIVLEVTGATYEDHQLDFPLAPSRGVIYRDQDPSLIPYVIAPESVVDEFYPKQLTDAIDPFIIKDVRGTTVYVYPFRYNAATQTLRIYKSVTIKLTDDHSTPVNPLQSTPRKIYRDMEPIYKSVFINYSPAVAADDLSVGETGDILVIATARDEDAIQPYIDWKREKGYDVFLEIVATGTNVKNLVQQKYNENNDILYVQLVGDWNDIKCNLGGGSNAPMDPMLGCVAGSDNFPDIAVGRFPAGSPGDVTVQVNKTINYEKNPSGNWYSKAIGVASNQGPGDDNEYDYQHLNVIWNNKLAPFTYDNYSTAYDPSGTAAQVKTYIENGAGIINYCGHGSMTSWGSTGFSNTNIAQLANGDMLPFIFSVACLNGAFHMGECFAEAWLKKQNGGAVMTLMSTISQPWDPPMRGQDYYNDILTGGYNYTSNPGNGISTDEGRSIAGSIVVNGDILMYTESNTTSDLNTMATWTIFGDAALQVRTETPEEITVSNTTVPVGSDYQGTVTAGGAPVAGALVALSQDGVYASTYTDGSGNFSIANDFLPGDVLLVVTGFNLETVYETIQCIPPTGPYVIFDQVEVNSQSGLLEYGETSTLDLSMKNAGVAQATNVVVTISTDDDYVTVTDGTENFGNIAANETKTVENAFEVDVANGIPDGHSVVFSVTATAENTWESSFALNAVAGELEYGEYTIVDNKGNNNGKLDPGETVDVAVSILNAGGAGATNVSGVLSCSDPYITITQAQMNYGNIAAGDNAVMNYEVTADAATPTGHSATFSLNITADKELSAQGSFIIVVGQIPILIIDMDENHNSANQMAEALDEIGLPYDEATEIPDDLSFYTSVFLCLGIYSDNHVLTDGEGQQLADFLNDGGSLYMEGGDTWAYDLPTPVHDLFNIDGVADGSGDMGTILGKAGTFTENMSYNYTGDNNWMDHIDAVSPAFVIFSNQSPAYNCAVAYDAGSYKTIGTSFEFGGLANSDATKKELMEAYLEFFGILQTLTADFTANNTTIAVGESVQFTNTSTGNPDSFLWNFEGGNPATSTEENPLVVYDTPGNYDVSLTVTSGTANATEQKKDFITVTPPLTSQVINIPAGWSGLSSYLIPENTNLEVLLQQIAGELIILQSMDGVYYPQSGINTIGQWDNHTGYQIKTTGGITLTINGWEDNSHEINLQKGWNLMPVLSDCNVSVAGLLGGTGGAVIIVKEIAGSGIYWPSMNINTLEWLIPGKAYWVRTVNDVTITFPSCE